MYISNDLHLTDSTFEGNQSNYYAALHLESQNLTLENVTFKGNISRIEDAAALSFGVGQSLQHSLVIRRCEFQENSAAYGTGAAVYLEDRDFSVELQISNNLFENNSAQNAAVLELPAKIEILLGSIFSDNTIINNVSTSIGAIFLGFGKGGLRLFNNTFVNNSGNGGFCITGNNPTYIENLEEDNVTVNIVLDSLTFSQNKGDNLIHFSFNMASTISMKNCLFENNEGQQIFLVSSYLTD